MYDPIADPALVCCLPATPLLACGPPGCPSQLPELSNLRTRILAGVKFQGAGFKRGRALKKFAEADDESYIITTDRSGSGMAAQILKAAAGTTVTGVIGIDYVKHSRAASAGLPAQVKVSLDAEEGGQGIDVHGNNGHNSSDQGSEDQGQGQVEGKGEVEVEDEGEDEDEEEEEEGGDIDSDEMGPLSGGRTPDPFPRATLSLSSDGQNGTAPAEVASGPCLTTEHGSKPWSKTTTIGEPRIKRSKLAVALPTPELPVERKGL